MSRNMLGLAPGFLDSSPELDPASWAKLTALPGAPVWGSLLKTVDGCLVLGNPLLCPKCPFGRQRGADGLTPMMVPVPSADLVPACSENQDPRRQVGGPSAPLGRA